MAMLNLCMLVNIFAALYANALFSTFYRVQLIYRHLLQQFEFTLCSV